MYEIGDVRPLEFKNIDELVDVYFPKVLNFDKIIEINNLEADIFEKSLVNKNNYYNLIQKSYLSMISSISEALRIGNYKDEQNILKTLRNNLLGSVPLDKFATRIKIQVKVTEFTEDGVELIFKDRYNQLVNTVINEIITKCELTQEILLKTDIIVNSLEMNKLLLKLQIYTNKGIIWTHMNIQKEKTKEASCIAYPGISCDNELIVQPTIFIW